MDKKETALRESCSRKFHKETTLLVNEGSKQNTEQCSYYQTICEAATGKRLNGSAAEWLSP